MGIFGWSLPPGCSTLPDEEPAYCEICGRSVDNDECICPACPVCEKVGDPLCYKEHGMVRTQSQIDSMAEVESALKAETEGEQRMFAEEWADSLDDRDFQWKR